MLLWVFGFPCCMWLYTFPTFSFWFWYFFFSTFLLMWLRVGQSYWFFQRNKSNRLIERKSVKYSMGHIHIYYNILILNWILDGGPVYNLVIPDLFKIRNVWWTKTRKLGEDNVWFKVITYKLHNVKQINLLEIHKWD